MQKNCAQLNSMLVEPVHTEPIHIDTVPSGHLLCDERVGTCEEVDMLGLLDDAMRKRLLCIHEIDLRISAYEDCSIFIGRKVLPAIGLHPGFRYLNVRNELGRPLISTSHFPLNSLIEHRIPDDIPNLVEALANPVVYQNELKKHGKQFPITFIAAA
uniref:Uncharacterized protein n=1 Tax=Glossina pallidipes TaxID=7398 RepID=A0A1A9ZXK3_GLOPL